MTVMIVRALDDQEQSTFPQRESTEELLMQRSQAAIAFACQKMNDPVNLKGNFLKTSWLHGYQWTDEMEESGGLRGLREFSAIYAGVDPSTSDDDTADFASICIGGVCDSQLYLLRLFQLHISVFELKELLVQLHGMYSFHRIFFESVAAQAFMADFLSSGTWLPIEKSPTTGPKSFRFSLMSGKFQASRVLVPMDWRRDDNPCVPEFQPFYDEWKEFREDAEGSHDDTLDAVEKLVGGATASPDAAGSTSDAVAAQIMAEYNDPERRSHIFEKQPAGLGYSMRSRLGGLTRKERQSLGMMNQGQRMPRLIGNR